MARRWRREHHHLRHRNQRPALYKEPSEDPRQPHIVELAALLYDDQTGEQNGHLHSIIRPDGWTIPDDVAEIHGITTERAMDEGRPEAEVLAEFLELHSRCALRVAHNEAFDQRIVRIAIKRFGDRLPGWMGYSQERKDEMADVFKAAPKYCTMKAATKPCDLPPTPAMLARGMKWNKNPSMSEAYLHFTGKDLGEDAHSALFDARACAEVYFAMNPVAVAA